MAPAPIDARTITYVLLVKPAVLMVCAQQPMLALEIMSAPALKFAAKHHHVNVKKIKALHVLVQSTALAIESAMAGSAMSLAKNLAVIQMKPAAMMVYVSRLRCNAMPKRLAMAIKIASPVNAAKMVQDVLIRRIA